MSGAIEPSSLWFTPLIATYQRKKAQLQELFVLAAPWIFPSSQSVNFRQSLLLLRMVEILDRAQSQRGFQV
jgi:hypothetical protein